MLSDCKISVKKHFLPEYLRFHETPTPFHFEEKKKGGEGKAFFSPKDPCLIMKAKDKAPMIWSFSNRNCAEGAFITFEDDGCRLHILEMKSKLTQGEWAKVLRQLEGMYLTSLAVCRLLGIHDFKEVICYVAYTEDAMSANENADMIFMKTFVGVENPVGGDDEWIVGRLGLPFDVIAKLKKGVRGADKNVDFGQV
ncbi:MULTISPECIES: hypothetical protein [unclassified Rhizobium]|uniref:hypothetical protein n=1 Tax=unclassified Rhizobium TaxID=2613769 RepID=UPI001782A6CB|nr:MULTISPECIES: hypothetical protein [unclassified Rhizobium]MBD8689341.1 hypothetical protein [Rhizobium sp. CFBP 13644]MBD8693113.1 hypothetical protein [Rhizobium sp. CFBP 13717]